ncbi:hypothetical protein [Serratia marcescens]|uniref:hypothetical protein n=1 Tax=Serratia marcescens TaxID=615 RepID=UPI0034E8ABEC
MSKETGGQAFPMLGNVGYNSEWQLEEGMTLRDYFAAKAMSSLVISGLNTDAWSDYDDMAGSAYSIADAMLKARND